MPVAKWVGKAPSFHANPNNGAKMYSHTLLRTQVFVTATQNSDWWADSICKQKPEREPQAKIREKAAGEPKTKGFPNLVKSHVGTVSTEEQAVLSSEDHV